MRVERQVRQQLLDLHGVREHERLASAGIHHELDARPDQQRDAPPRRADRLVQIERHRLQNLLSAERQQLPRQPRATRCRQLDRSYAVALLAVGQRLRQQAAVRADHREEVVEVLRDPAGQPPDGLHLLELARLRLRIRTGGDVARRPGESANGRIVEKVLHEDLDGSPALVLVLHARRDLASRIRPALREHHHLARQCLAVVGMDQLEGVVPDQLRDGMTEQPFDGWADIGEAALQIEDRDDLRRALRECPEQSAALLAVRRTERMPAPLRDALGKTDLFGRIRVHITRADVGEGAVQLAGGRHGNDEQWTRSQGVHHPAHLFVGRGPHEVIGGGGRDGDGRMIPEHRRHAEALVRRRRPPHGQAGRRVTEGGIGMHGRISRNGPAFSQDVDDAPRAEIRERDLRDGFERAPDVDACAESKAALRQIFRATPRGVGGGGAVVCSQRAKQCALGDQSHQVEGLVRWECAALHAWTYRQI